MVVDRLCIVCGLRSRGLPHEVRWRRPCCSCQSRRRSCQSGYAHSKTSYGRRGCIGGRWPCAHSSTPAHPFCARDEDAQRERSRNQQADPDELAARRHYRMAFSQTRDSFLFIVSTEKHTRADARGRAPTASYHTHTAVGIRHECDVFSTYRARLHLDVMVSRCCRPGEVVCRRNKGRRGNHRDSRLRGHSWPRGSFC